MDYITKSIFRLRPSAQLSFINEDYSTIKWDVLDGEAPTQSEIDAEIVKIKAQEEADKAVKVADKAALLEKLGITEEEASLLLG